MEDEELNHHWQVINQGGRVVSTTPEQLWEAAVSYFEWCEKRPIKIKRTLTSGKTQGQKVEIEFVRPYEVKAFCLHANISQRYLDDIKNTHDKDSEWYIVMERILYVIYNQNLEGAMVDIYNPIMVSKVLNMDKPGDNDSNRNPKVEITESQSDHLANSENEILQNLDYGKVESLKEKVENIKRENDER